MNLRRKCVELFHWPTNENLRGHVHRSGRVTTDGRRLQHLRRSLSLHISPEFISLEIVIHLHCTTY